MLKSGTAPSRILSDSGKHFPHFLVTLYSLKIKSCHFIFTTQRRETFNSFANWKRSMLTFSHSTITYRQLMRIFFPSLCSQSHPFSTRQGPTTKSSTQFMVFKQLGEGWKWFYQPIYIKLIITEFATVNTVMMFTQIKYSLAFFEDKWCILYPIFSKCTKRTFLHKGGSIFSSAHQLCWL